MRLAVEEGSVGNGSIGIFWDQNVEVVCSSWDPSQMGQGAEGCVLLIMLALQNCCS